jgi:hypothetical protein
MDTTDCEECCPRFDPAPWDEKLITWKDRTFVQDRVTSLFHIPLNYGAVMARNLESIKAEEALAHPRMILTDENSLWGADVYFEVVKEVPGRALVHMSGTFLTKVFEGPFSNVKKWVGEMSAYAGRQGRKVEKLYFFYTTCPICAKKYGKNYVVLLAKV